MNKQEWSQWISNVKVKTTTRTPFGKRVKDVIEVRSLERLLETLPDENEQPIIPSFVHKWIRYHQKDRKPLIWALTEGPKRTEIIHWLMEGSYSEKAYRETILIKAWFNGYDVEPDPVEYITEKLVNHVRSDDFEDILRSSIREFVIKNGAQ